jgi:hypothetical protein
MDLDRMDLGEGPEIMKMQGPLALEGQKQDLVVVVVSMEMVLLVMEPTIKVEVLLAMQDLLL